MCKLTVNVALVFRNHIPTCFFVTSYQQHVKAKSQINKNITLVLKENYELASLTTILTSCVVFTHIHVGLIIRRGLHFIIKI
jgi:hypothetical protein